MNPLLFVVGAWVLIYAGWHRLCVVAERHDRALGVRDEDDQ